MLKFFEFNKQIDLSYLALDWDDNILHMPTMIHLDRLVNGKLVHEPVTTAKFAEVRTDPDWKRRPDTFAEFRDWGPRGDNAFLEDTITAIKNGDFGPSWDKFIEYLSKGTIFSIITARGHEPNSIKKAIEWIIDNYLSENQKHELYSHCLKYAYFFRSDYDKYDRIPKGQFSQTPLVQDYLSNCDYYGVSAESFIEKFGLGDSNNPEKGKELAIKEFTKKINEFGEKLGAKSVSLGFSDDDIRNVQHVTNLFRNELSLMYAMKYSIFDTSNKHIKGGIKTKINPVEEGQSSFGLGAQTWGMDSSVLPFTKWNNMTKRLFNTSDVPSDDYHNQFLNHIGQLKDLTDDISKKKS
jgi:hypothetical protein